MEEIQNLAKRLLELNQEFDAWIEENSEDGDPIIDDEDWYDGRAEWWEAVGDVGIQLAEAVKRNLGVI